MCVIEPFQLGMDQPGKKVVNLARGQTSKKRCFPCPRSCRRVWSPETSLTVVPSSVSPLIHRIPPSATASTYYYIPGIIYTVNRHLVCPEFNGSHICVPMAFTYGDRGILIFSVQLTTSRIGNLTRLIHKLLYVMSIHTYMHTVHNCMYW